MEYINKLLVDISLSPIVIVIFRKSVVGFKRLRITFANKNEYVI